MDALPVAERVDIPLHLKLLGTCQPIGVMHACAKDSAYGYFISTAEVLASLKKELKVQ
jgi:metal-dependent amidase/aminoacylase/carboxypeptidase family protein